MIEGWTGVSARRYAENMSNQGMAPDMEQGAAHWHRLVEKALAGAPAEALAGTLDTGEKAQPLYTPAEAGEHALASGYPGAPPFVRGATGQPAGGRGWRVLQLADQADSREANRAAQEDLANGADGLWLQSAGSLAYGAGELAFRDLADLSRALADIPLDRTPVYLSPGTRSLPAIALLLALAGKQKVAPHKLSGALGLDPLSSIAACGEAPVRVETALAGAVDAALFARQQGFAMVPFVASSRVWHQAGGSAVEELSCVLSAAVAYWRALAAAEVPLEAAARMIAFHLSADSDVFLTIAKFRAARALWARATEAAGIAPQPIEITAEMSFRTMTRFDPHTNLLRGTAAAFAAGVGGARAIVLLPFTAAAGVPDAFARRLARNTQTILAEESGLGRVVDAAGGAWYVERLTHDLAAQAWRHFQEVEAAGGLLAALKSGLIAGRLAAVHARRDNEIARRERAITGVSTYPHIDEVKAAAMPDTAAHDDELVAETDLELPAARQGERMAALVAAADRGAKMADLAAALREPCEPIPEMPAPARRDAAGFEALRAASDEAREVAGVRPSVFLANIGPLAAYTERATWARNFFEAGGIAAVPGDGANSAQALAAEFRNSGASIACLCGRDADYAALAGIADALREAGAVAVYITATPATLDGLADVDLRAIDRVLYEGCNALSILREAHQRLQVGEVIAAARRRQAEDARTGWARESE